MIPRILRYLFFEDYLAKLVCLAIGAGLWFYVEFARVTQTTLNVSIEYTKKPANLYFKAGYPRFAKITIRGRDEFIKFSNTGIKAEVSLGNARSGEGKYPLLFDTRQLPERVELVEKPDTVTVMLERGATKRVPVRAVTSGSPDNAFRVGKIRLTPNEVDIDGPEALLANLTAIDTEAVDISASARAINRKVMLRTPDQVSIDRIKSVNVHIEFLPKTFSEEVQFDQIPLKIQNLDAALNAVLSDNTVQVYLQGEASAIKNIKPSEIYAYINAEDTRFNARTGNILPYANESGVPVKVRILAGSKKIQVGAITPDKVNIRFSVKSDYLNKKSQPSTNTEENGNAEKN